jgi:hypothetical protein
MAGVDPWLLAEMPWPQIRALLDRGETLGVETGLRQLVAARRAGLGLDLMGRAAGRAKQG